MGTNAGQGRVKHAGITLFTPLAWALVGVVACSDKPQTDDGTTGTDTNVDSSGTTESTNTSESSTDTSETDTSETETESESETSDTDGPADAFVQEAYVKASNTDNLNLFGYAVAISGDTMVVGSRGEASSATGIDGDQLDTSAPNSGAVYVFVRDGMSWSQQAYIKASNTDVEDGFGYSVAISGDTLVVGAANEDSAATGVDGVQSDNTASETGAAYVFVRTGTTWTQQAYLKGSNTDVNDWFGNSVAISGETVVVGAFQEDGGSTGVDGNQADKSAGGSGAAYVFVRAGSTWTQEAYIKASNTEGNDRFANAVALSGDTLAVAASSESSDATGQDGDQTDNSAGASGAVYVFGRTGTTWAQEAYLKASNTDAGDGFGSALAMSGDTLVVGALGEASNSPGVDADQFDDAAMGSGAGYVFMRDGSSWTQAAYLKPTNPGAADNFGIALALSGDTLLVGSSSEASSATGIDGNQSDGTQPRSGAAYAFVRTAGIWTQEAYIKASNTDADDYFGGAVGLSGDTLVIGAGFEDSDATGIDGDQANDSAPDSGAVYVLRCDASLCP